MPPGTFFSSFVFSQSFLLSRTLHKLIFGGFPNSHTSHAKGGFRFRQLSQPQSASVPFFVGGSFFFYREKGRWKVTNNFFSALDSSSIMHSLPCARRVSSNRICSFKWLIIPLHFTDESIFRFWGSPWLSPSARWFLWCFSSVHYQKISVPSRPQNTPFHRSFLS